MREDGVLYMVNLDPNLSQRYPEEEDTKRRKTQQRQIWSGNRVVREFR